MMHLNLLHFTHYRLIANPHYLRALKRVFVAIILPIYYAFYLLIIVPLGLAFITTMLLWINIKKFISFIKNKLEA